MLQMGVQDPKSLGNPIIESLIQFFALKFEFVRYDNFRDRLRRGLRMPLFAPVQPRLGDHKNCPGLNFEFIHRIFHRVRRPLMCKNPPLRFGVV